MTASTIIYITELLDKRRKQAKANEEETNKVVVDLGKKYQEEYAPMEEKLKHNKDVALCSLVESKRKELRDAKRASFDAEMETKRANKLYEEFAAQNW